MKIVLTAENPREEQSLAGQKEVVISDAKEYLVLALAVVNGLQIVHPRFYGGSLDYLAGAVYVMNERFRTEMAGTVEAIQQAMIAKVPAQLHLVTPKQIEETGEPEA